MLRNVAGGENRRWLTILTTTMTNKAWLNRQNNPEYNKKRASEDAR
ncbi:MAG: hypothetical protein ABL911_07750 [Gallionella sp.]|nr:hypothetical protein [Gallionella sp.]